MKQFNKKIIVLLLLHVFACNTFAFATTTVFPPDQVRSIQCYPNPAATSINFEITKQLDKTLNLCIYNFVGKKVAEIKIQTSKVNVSLNNYFRGLYFFQLKDLQGRILESGKFQVIK